MSDTKKKLMRAFETLGMHIAHKAPGEGYWTPEDFANMLVPLLDEVWIYCPNCRNEAAQVKIIGCGAEMQVQCACGVSGPRRTKNDEAIAAWETIKVQGKYGTPEHNCGIQAIDDIHSLFEECQRRGMKSEPIGFPNAGNGMRGQIERFIRKVTT